MLARKVNQAQGTENDKAVLYLLGEGRQALSVERVSERRPGAVRG